MDGKSVIIIALYIIKLSFAPNPRVNTTLGIIEGTVGYTYTGSPFFQFEGVPYAAPPVGDLRYENPQDPPKWHGTLMAKVKTFCYQYMQYKKDRDGNYSVIGDEDCLYYNVYTPTLNQSSNLDVLIFIHGGAFMYGEGYIWSPTRILDRHIVYVSINYRLGPLGFLSTEDAVLPGNLGLRDQQQALKWIKQNIHYFGGNSNSITLQGLSAGGASIHIHTLSPRSKGLFHRGILMSGMALNNWVLMEKPLEQTKKLASLVGCPTENTTALKRCLKSKPARQILDNTRYFQPFLYNPFSPWAVVVDGYWSSDPVLPAHPLQLLRRKEIYDIPLIISFVTSEGLYPGSDFYIKDEYLGAIDTRWNELMPHILMYNFTVDHNVIHDVSQAIRQTYLGNSSLERGESYFSFIQAISDRCFVADIEKGLRLHSAGIQSSVWTYMFNYRGNFSISNSFTGTTDNLGVCHGDDLLYSLSPGRVSLNTHNDVNMAKVMLDMIVSFMVQGAPNISTTWKPVSKIIHDNINLLQINRYDELIPVEKTYIGNRPFWDSLPFDENEKLLKVKLRVL